MLNVFIWISKVFPPWKWWFMYLSLCLFLVFILEERFWHAYGISPIVWGSFVLIYDTKIYKVIKHIRSVRQLERLAILWEIWDKMELWGGVGGILGVLWLVKVWLEWIILMWTLLGLDSYVNGEVLRYKAR